jgi:phosphoglycerate dehydrogenase-like enzyme
VLDQADYISLHVPLTDSTFHLIDAAALDQMKRGALVINTSRGAVIDEAALMKALAAGRIAGAALDVFESEPLDPNSPLRTMDQVVLSPHAAGYSIESWADLRKEMCETVADWISQSWSDRVVNPEVRSRLRTRKVVR